MSVYEHHVWYNDIMAIEKIVKRTTLHGADSEDKEYWKSKTPGQRVRALTDMVNASLGDVDESSQRLQRICRVFKRT